MTMTAPFSANAEVSVLPYHEPVPGFGVLPMHAFLLKAQQPVLIDTGMPMATDDFLTNLRSLIDPAEIRWIFITHADRDHSGNIEKVLELAPNARVVANFVSFAKMAGDFAFPMPRAYFTNPGQSFSAGDRELQVFQPPMLDSGGTLGLYDAKSGTLFGADAFGAIIPGPAENVTDVPEEAWAQGFSVFNRANTPWLPLVDETKFAAALKQVSDFAPKQILGTHLPVATGKTEALIKAAMELPAQGPFVGPDQAALEAMLAQMTGH